MAAREIDVTEIKSAKIATDMDATQSKNEKEQTTRSLEEEELNAKSFTSALREKYCFDNYTPSGSCIIQFHSKASKDGSKAELSHLRNVDLSATGLVCAGLPNDGLASLCPNIVDLNISWNNLDAWNKILPILYQLPYLQYVNLSGNQIISHQQYLDELEKPLESIQNLVLNHTNISLEEVLKLTRILPSLKELHICNNGYRELCCIEDNTLKNIECLRANNNQLKSWSEVWKLRHLMNLQSLILSGNPLQDVFYDHQCCENETACNDNDSTASRDSGNNTLQDRDTSNNDSTTSQDNGNNTLQDRDTSNNDSTASQDNGNNTLQDRDTSNNQGCDQNDIFAQPGCSSALQTSENKTTIPETDILTSEAAVRVSSSQPQPIAASQHKSCDTIHRSEVQSEILEACQNVVSDLFNTACENSLIDSENMEQNYFESVEREDEEGQNSQSQKSQSTSDDSDFNSSENTSSSLSDVKSVKTKRGCDDDSERNRQRYDSLQSEDGGEVTTRLNQPSTIEEEGQKTEGEGINKLCKPFRKLHTLCLTETKVDHWKHLQALTQFPVLKSVRLKDTGLYCDAKEKDRRLLLLASLPNIQIFNGSEVTSTERETSERFFIRHYLDHDESEKPGRVEQLENKHGKLSKVVDVFIGGKFNANPTATVVFYHNDRKLLTQKLNLKDTVHKLFRFVKRKVNMHVCAFNLYHFPCGSGHDFKTDLGEFPEKEELFISYLPLSRFNIYDGDEIHIESPKSWDTASH
ncbi:tubulin-specific chaperone cofactor E-like protein [Patella vulgata]|uniref:tubulin-specific chaperone cofactor E-like protein n=1 Tax=Patella vulgata TaxID=6465 RepID=UPI0024A8A0F2|nr:tubulin-specific chaperone cofactor E-like protein [Patella vulgata]